MHHEPAAAQPLGDAIDWDAWIEERREVFERRLSFNQHCRLLLDAAGPGWARMRMPLRPEVMNPFGAAHGGAVSALIDSVAGTTVAAGTLPDDRIMGTIDLQVHFLERAAGTELVAEGRLVRAGKAVAVATVEVRDDRAALVAIGTATFRLGPPDVRRRNED
ncbi:MAG: PaaI family thioesterase [Dehalococcoidia bacterium]